MATDKTDKKSGPRISGGPARMTPEQVQEATAKLAKDLAELRAEAIPSVAFFMDFERQQMLFQARGKFDIKRTVVAVPFAIMGNTAAALLIAVYGGDAPGVTLEIDDEPATDGAPAPRGG